ncbi:ribonuclease HI [Pseudoscourfieldia marina]
MSSGAFTSGGGEWRWTPLGVPVVYEVVASHAVYAVKFDDLQLANTTPARGSRGERYVFLPGQLVAPMERKPCGPNNWAMRVTFDGNDAWLTELDDAGEVVLMRKHVDTKQRCYQVSSHLSGTFTSVGVRSQPDYDFAYSISEKYTGLLAKGRVITTDARVCNSKGDAFVRLTSVKTANIQSWIFEKHADGHQVLTERAVEVGEWIFEVSNSAGLAVRRWPDYDASLKLEGEELKKCGSFVAARERVQGEHGDWMYRVDGGWLFSTREGARTMRHHSSRPVSITSNPGENVIVMLDPGRWANGEDDEAEYICFVTHDDGRQVPHFHCIGTVAKQLNNCAAKGRNVTGVAVSPKGDTCDLLDIMRGASRIHKLMLFHNNQYFLHTNKGFYWKINNEHLEKQINKQMHDIVSISISPRNGSWIVIYSNRYVSSTGVPDVVGRTLGTFFKEHHELVAKRSSMTAGYDAAVHTIERIPLLSQVEKAQPVLQSPSSHASSSHQPSLRRFGDARHLEAHTDGASRGNPGDAAIGVIFYDSLTQMRLLEIQECIGTRTNNEAEYHAVITTLELVLKEVNGCPLADRVLSLLVQTDSELLARQIQGTYRVSAENLKPLHSHACDLLARLNTMLANGARIEHVGRSRVADADQVANEALDRQSKRQCLSNSREGLPHTPPQKAFCVSNWRID